jgi:S-DNA-T family DNA segregation ATPase FtsK/SpoIIIE
MKTRVQESSLWHSFWQHLLGGGLLGCGVYIIFALLSYSPQDPCFAVATDMVCTNWCGLFGANLAEFGLQFLGGLGITIPFFLIIWGIRLWRGRGGHLWALRLVSFICGFSLLALALGVWWSQAGGMWGYILYSSFPFLSSLWARLAALILGLGCLSWGYGWGINCYLDFFNASLRGASFIGFVGVQLLRIKKRYGTWERTPSEKVDNKPSSRPVFEFSKPEPFLRQTSGGQQKASIPIGKADATSLKEILNEADDQGGVGSSRVPERTLTFGIKGEDKVHPLPSIDLLAQPTRDVHVVINKNDLQNKAAELQKVLKDFGVRGEIIKVNPGPVVSLFELEPAAGIKSSRVISLAEDIARSMHALSARVAIVPGRNIIGIELPNDSRQKVYLRDVLGDKHFTETHAFLPIALGKDIAGRVVVVDLARMPHLLVAGTTGSGKSVGINAMIVSLLYHLSPRQCRFLMVDPKMLELSVYNGIPHLLTPVITEPKKAVQALKWVVQEMENRYRLMSQLGVRNIAGYNQKVREAEKSGTPLKRTVQTGFDEQGKPIFEEQTLALETFPFIVVVVDEMADLMLVAGKDIEAAVQRLAQMARAAGIHLIMATQRPSVDVITGTIKANFPSRISFQVTSKIDSRTILGEQGAEQLLGQGDMLYMSSGGRILRVHGAFVSDQDIEAIVTFFKSTHPPIHEDDLLENLPEESSNMSGEMGDFGSDEESMLYRKAVEIVLQDKQPTASYIQRKLQIGYNRSARLIERMENEGIVSSRNHAGKRTILASGGTREEKYGT